MTLLVDLAAVPDACCDHHMDLLHKAIAEGDVQDDGALWRPHENPWITELVEESTLRFQRLLRGLADAFTRALTGRPLGELRKAEGDVLSGAEGVPWRRWTPEELERFRLTHEGQDPATFELEDWLGVCDFLVQRYLPDNVLRTEAEFLTIRATLAGKIAANMGEKRNAPPPSMFTHLIPTEFRAVPERVLTKTEVSILRCAAASAAENISDVTEAARHKMRQIVIEHVQAKVLGQQEGRYDALRSRLFDNFAVLNRDFRRIAVTEGGECCNQGFVGACAPGQKVVRHEAYRGACDFCRSINGKVFTVVDAAASSKNGEKDVWLGKTNIGRSASPRRKIGTNLVERTENERWWPAAGVQHPNCRGSWSPAPDTDVAASSDFEAWMQGVLEDARAGRPIRKRNSPPFPQP